MNVRSPKSTLTAAIDELPSTREQIDRIVDGSMNWGAKAKCAFSRNPGEWDVANLPKSIPRAQAIARERCKDCRVTSECAIFAYVTGLEGSIVAGVIHRDSDDRAELVSLTGMGADDLEAARDAHHGKTKTPSHCIQCKRKMRPRRGNANPPLPDNEVYAGGKGYCRSCHGKHSHAAKKAS